MVLYSSTNLDILKSWTNILCPRRFDFGFSRTSKQIYRSLQYRRKVFGEFQALPHFLKKMVLFCNLWTNIQSFKRLDLVFWQTPKQVYRKLQCNEKVFGEFYALPHFPKEMVLYSSTKFDILKPWTNISWPRRFYLRFLQTSKQVYRKLQYRENVFGEFQALLRFPTKMVSYLLTKLSILKPWTNIQSLRRFNLGL